MPNQQEIRLGQKVGKYRLVHKLGDGGFGTVYLAQDRYERTQVAVKVLHISLTKPEDFKDFLNEARMIGLHHPHIVPLLNIGISRNGLPFLVMEYAPEGTLRDHHPKGERVALSTIVSYVDQIASALQYAHDQRVIHRDVKPANILVRADGTLLVSDFGVAKFLEESVLVSRQTQVGTPTYMAPEQHMGYPCFASDQYALAVVVYEWICGVRPFQGTALGLAVQHMNTPPPRLRDHLPELSESVECVIFKALAKAPEDRFERIEEMASALHEAVLPQPNTMVLGSSLEAGNTVPLISPKSQRQVAVTTMPSSLPNPFPLASPLTQAVAGYPVEQKSRLTQGKAFLLIVLLCMILLQALQQGSQQIFGSQGWAYVLGGSIAPARNLLGDVGNQLHGKTTITPERYIDTIIQNMTLDQKLGQMMLVQFVGSDFSLDLNTMISQYHVGSVLLLAGNHNIVSKGQLTSLTQQIQRSSSLPMMISLDQEGGLVDRLADLDGPRPSAAQIAATGDPTQVITAGKRDAQDLSQYGINLQLAPVVDVGTPSSLLQQQERTFGQNADAVTKMAGAYLQGLQQSGKVLGTLKHFPGLGSSTEDPHQGLPHLNHTQAQLDQIDWAPYRNLINQGLVHAIMVMHEVVTAFDTTTPASLSSKLVTGVLRNQMGFQGVVMTDSLTMEGLSAYYSAKQAAILAVEAGSDIIMGADTPSTVAAIVQGIKEVISAGEVNQQRIDQSVSRILMMKYQMGLLTLPKN
jgi:beta-N-acetylhexosaminidase